MAPPRRAIKSNVLEALRATSGFSVWMSGSSCGLQILKVVVRWDFMTLLKLLLKLGFSSIQKRDQFTAHAVFTHSRDKIWRKIAPELEGRRKVEKGN